jgi:hypothetical protein
VGKKSVGSLIDKVHALREDIKAKTEEVKTLGAAKDEVEQELLALMDAEGVTKATGQRASVSISELVKPSVTNWDEFYKYIHRSRYYHLLERRPSVSGCCELFETKGSIPGVEPYIKRGINIRSI